MLSTQMGLDVIQLLLLMDIKEDAVVRLLKNLNSSNSIEVLKSLKAQAIILKEYGKAYSESLNYETASSRNTVIKRNTSRNRMLDYAYSNYLYKDNYEFFAIESLTDRVNEINLRSRVNFLISNGLINTNKAVDDIVLEILVRDKNVKMISMDRTKTFNTILQDDTLVPTGISAISIRDMIDSNYCELPFVEAETGMSLINYSDNLLEQYRNDFNKLIPIVSIEALGYNNSGNFGFYKHIDFRESVRETGTLSIKFIPIIEKIFSLAMNSLEKLDTLINVLNDIIVSPRETITYLGKNIISLQKNSPYVYASTYKQNMEKLKSRHTASKETVNAVADSILAECKALIKQEKINKISFENVNAQNYNQYATAISNSDSLSNKDKQLYGICLQDKDKLLFNEIDPEVLNRMLSNQVMFIKSIADRHIITETCKTDLPKSVLTLLKLYALIDKPNGNLEYYNDYFNTSELTVEDWCAVADTLRDELTIVFCGFNSSEILKDYTLISCAVSQEVFSSVTISPQTSILALNLARGISSFKSMFSRMG